MQKSVRPWSIWIVVALFSILALNALPVGFFMMRAPHEDFAGMPVAYIEPTIFGSWLVPGFFLFTFLGIGSVCAIYVLLARPGWKWAQRLNPFQRLRWEWTFAAGMGVATMVWITVQVLILRVYFFLQPMVFVMGLIIVLLMVAPGMRRYFAAPGAAAFRMPEGALVK